MRFPRPLFFVLPFTFLFMSSPNIAENYEKVRNLFAAAFDLAPEKRAEFLRRMNEDENVIAEVKSLLDSCAEAGEFLNDVSAADSVRDSLERRDSFIGRTIDQYRIEKEIGRGGMGVVFLAAREDFRQQVALKLIKRGMDSDAILERFRREREILAALNHPNIARLLDGGTTADDLPFFVMEYVEGIPIDEFCRTNDLPETAKLELFRKVCGALIFAHQKLIVHRDLKPSNILVTGDGTPKLLDFGIAKLLDSTAAETQTNQRVLTPAYASPEQIRGEAVDTKSDVYSLGKILAEILLGENFKDLKFPTTEHQFSTLSKQKLNTDLHNILAMSLREDAARRYGSVERFSEDIRLYLAGLPVTARKDTFSYRAAKFLKRNRFAAAVSTLFIVALLISFAAILKQSQTANRERETAMRERKTAERRLGDLRKMSDSFTKEIHGAIENLPGSLPARQMLMRHAVEQLDQLAAESADNPALQDELAQAYYSSAQLPDMSLTEKDLTLRKEIAIYGKLVAAEPSNIHYQEQMALGYGALSDISKVRGSLADALEFDQTGVSMLEQIVRNEPNSVEHHVNLAYILINTATVYVLEGKIEDASLYSRKTVAEIEEIRKLDANEPELVPLTDQIQIEISAEQARSSEYKPAIKVLRRMLGKYETQLAKNGNDTSINYYIWAINRRLADTFQRSGDNNATFKHLQTSVKLIENLLAGSPKDFGYHRNSAATHILFGELLMSRNQSATALENFRRAAELSDYVVQGDTDNSEAKTDLARANANIGNILILKGKQNEGLEYLKKAFASFQELAARDAENAELKLQFSQTRDWLNAAQKTKSAAK